MLTRHSDSDELEGDLLYVEIRPEMALGYSKPCSPGDELSPFTLRLDYGVPYLAWAIIVFPATAP